MPRARRTQSGAPAAAPAAPVDVPYGEGEARIESQRRMPVPDFAQTGAPAPSAGGTGGGGAAGGGEDASRFAQAIAAAQGMTPPQGLMSAPSQRPTESLMAGVNPAAPPHQGPEFQNALFDLRAMAADYPEYKGLLRLIALGEEQT